MPYITQSRRKAMQDGAYPENEGELNYLVTRALLPVVPAIQHYLANRPQKYATYQQVFGAVFMAVVEIIRRMFPMYAVYENHKCRENGDVYGDEP